MKGLTSHTYRGLLGLAAGMLSLCLGAMLAMAPGQSAQASSPFQVERATPTDELTPGTPPETSGSPSAGTIQLFTNGAPASAWTSVEWKDTQGLWHAVNGWQGGLDAAGQRLWWVDQADLGTTGVYRWVVYEEMGGLVWATSATFRLPTKIGEGVSVSLAAPASSTPSPSRAASALPDHYVVRAGDTLYRIALRFQTTVTALQAANGLAGIHIYPGQSLIIPGHAAPTPGPAPTLRTDPIPKGRYVVQPGDTVYRIALRARTTVDAILVANHLYSPGIRIGQVLVIP
jgi:LysM repeat protein